MCDSPPPAAQHPRAAPGSCGQPLLGGGGAALFPRAGGAAPGRAPTFEEALQSLRLVHHLHSWAMHGAGGLEGEPGAGHPRGPSSAPAPGRAGPRRGPAAAHQPPGNSHEPGTELGLRAGSAAPAPAPAAAPPSGSGSPFPAPPPPPRGPCPSAGRRRQCAGGPRRGATRSAALLPRALAALSPGCSRFPFPFPSLPESYPCQPLATHVALLPALGGRPVGLQGGPKGLGRHPPVAGHARWSGARLEAPLVRAWGRPLPTHPFHPCPWPPAAAPKGHSPLLGQA